MHRLVCNLAYPNVFGQSEVDVVGMMEVADYVDVCNQGVGTSCMSGEGLVPRHSKWNLEEERGGTPGRHCDAQ